MSGRHIVVARLLLIEGVLLIVLAFVHLLATPIVHQWLYREISPGANIPLLFYRAFVGVLLMPFGVSTLYSASGVRAGQAWARAIAMTNAFGVISLPVVLLVLGRQYFTDLSLTIAAILVTIIGLTMFLALLWVGGGEKP